MLDIVKKPKLQGSIISEGSYENLQPLYIRFKPKNSFCHDSVKVSLTISQSPEQNDAIYGTDFEFGDYSDPTRSPSFSQSNNDSTKGIITFTYVQTESEYILKIKPITLDPNGYHDDRRIKITLEPNQQVIETLLKKFETILLMPPQIGGLISLGLIGITTDYNIVVSENTPPTVQFAQSSLTVTEGDSAADVIITRSGSLSLQSFVSVYIVDGATADVNDDYSLTPYADLIFEPNESSLVLKFIAYSDLVNESSESVALKLYALNNAELGTNSELTLTILNQAV